MDAALGDVCVGDVLCVGVVVAPDVVGVETGDVELETGVVCAFTGVGAVDSSSFYPLYCFHHPYNSHAVQSPKPN